MMRYWISFSALVTFLSVAFLPSALLAETVRERDTHEHGSASLIIAMEGESFAIELESPLENIVGFEHAPKSAKEEAQLDQAIKTLTDGANLYIPPKEAKCTLVTTDVPPPTYEENEGEKHKDEEDKESHAEIIATYNFTCAAPANLKSIDIRLFTAFKGFEKIGVAFIGKKQSSATLTPKATVFRLP
jgi:hypothetical protein